MPKKPKGGRRNTDWEKMKADYVTDPSLSLKAVSEKYGVPLRTVALHSKAEDWFATKKEHRKKYCEELAQKLHQKKLDTLERELDAATNLSNTLYKVLAEDPMQFNRHLTMNLITGETTEELFSKLDVKAMKDAVGIIKIVEDLKRSILGIQRLENIQKHQLDVERMQIERERLELDKQKADFEDGDTEVTIRFSDNAEEWGV